jgi:hypothetical protein
MIETAVSHVTVIQEVHLITSVMLLLASAGNDTSQYFLYYLAVK